MKRLMLITIIFAAAVLCRAAGPWDDFRQGMATANYAQVMAALSEMPANQRDNADTEVLAVLPLQQWNAETKAIWDLVMQGIEQCNNYDTVNRELTAFITGAALPAIPRGAEMNALLDRAIAIAKKWGRANVPETVAKNLCWYGDFPRAFSVFKDNTPPEQVIDFALEVFADKPQYAKDPVVRKMVLDRVPNDGPVARKAIRALAYTGQIDLALQQASKMADPYEHAEGACYAGRYARYGKQMPGFEKGLLAALNNLPAVKDGAQALLVYRDVMQEAAALPLAPLSDAFWTQADKAARAFPAANQPVALAELAGALAWANRPNPDAVLKDIPDPTWRATAGVRVAQGLQWNGKKDQAKSVADAIADPAWKRLAYQELAYLADQQGDAAGAAELRKTLATLEGR